MDTLTPDGGGGGRHRESSHSRNTRQSVYVPSPESESMENTERDSDTLQSDGLSAVSAQAGVQPNHRSSLSEKRHPDNGHHKHKVLGNYVLGRTIGEGSFAKVKLAYHRLTNQQVAIKIIDKEKLPDEYSMRNIYRETDIMRMLNHPHIIQMFEIIETKKEYCIVLEYAAGGEVLDYIVAQGRLREAEAKKFIRQISNALQYLHGLGIVHRDLKAENFLLDPDGNIRISDFGLSNKYDKNKTLATCCGSPVYSAPELIEGKQYIGPEVDAWSLGINIYAMVVGDLPFANSNIAALYDAILKGKYETPSYLSTDCKDLISKLIVLNPKRRYTITQVQEHPWVGSNSKTAFLLDDDSSTSADKNSAGYPKSEKEIDQEVLEQMEQMGMERTKVIESILKMKYDQYGGTYNIFMAQKHLKVLPLVKIPGEEDSLSSNTSSMDRQKGGQSSSRPVTTASKTKPTEVVDLDDVARRHHGGTRKHSNSHAAAAADTEEGNYDNLARVMLMVSKGFDEGQQDHRDGERIGGGNSGITATGGGGGFSGVNKSRVASNSTAPKDLPPPKHRGGGEILESISNNTNQNRHSRDPSSGVNAVTASGGGNNNNNTTNTGTIKRGARPSVSISNGAGVGVVGGGSNISRPSTTNQQMDNNSRLLPDLVKPSASKKMDNSTGWGGGGHSLPPINVDSPGLRSIFGAMDLDVDSRPGSSSKYGTLAPGTMTANMTYSQVTSGGVESNGGGSYVTVGNTGGGAGKKVAVGANNAGNIYNSAPFAYNCQATSILPPETIMERLRKCLDRNGVSFTTNTSKVNSSNINNGGGGNLPVFSCSVHTSNNNNSASNSANTGSPSSNTNGSGDMSFEIELVKLPKQNLYGLKFKRAVGDMWTYKELSARLLADLRI